MKIKLIVVGKLKESHLKEAVSEYMKRLRRFAKVEVIEVADEKTPDKASLLENQQILAKEGKKISGKIGDNDYVIALAIEGKEMSSESLSGYFNTILVSGHSTVTVIIGGSLGLDEEIKKRADLLLSFGPMTFPHQLMRVMTLEQIYRSFMIQENSPYHK